MVKAAKLSISLHNQEGKRVKLFQNKQLETGLQQVDFAIDNLPTGTYFLKLEGGGQQFGKRVILYR